MKLVRFAGVGPATILGTALACQKSQTPPTPWAPALPTGCQTGRLDSFKTTSRVV